MIRYIANTTTKTHKLIQLACRFCTEIESSPETIGDYAIQSKIGGSSEQQLYDKYKNFHNRAIEGLQIPGTTIVRDKDHAHRVVKILKGLQTRPHAWDTETIDLDVKTESPIGNGKIICASAFCGIDINFGSGPSNIIECEQELIKWNNIFGEGLFVDNFAQNSDLIMVFKEYFEDKRFKKIWHNYGFDRHILNNHGINVTGFGGDTMHMARLANPSRGPKEYSLSNVTKNYAEQINEEKRRTINDLREIINNFQTQMQRVEQAINQGEEIDADIVRRYRLERFEDPQDKLEFMKAELIRYLNKKDCIKVYEENFLEANIKTSMKQLFGKKKYLKDGKEGKTIEFPSIIRMHTDADLVDNWVNYSCLDAEVTFFVHRVLTNELSALKTNFEDMKNNLDIYNKYWLPFGEILTDMERRGFELNLDHLEKIKGEATDDMRRFEKEFMDWVCSTQEGIEQFNPSSPQQLQQLFFAPFKKPEGRTKKKADDRHLSNSQRKDLMYDQQAMEEEDQMSSLENQGDNEESFNENGSKKSDRKKVDELPETQIFKILNIHSLIPEGKKKPPKQIEMKITGLGLKTIDFTDSNLPASDLPVLKVLAGNPAKGNFGKIGNFMDSYVFIYDLYYSAKGDDEMGKRASRAIESLIQLKQVETLLQTFILPLIQLSDSQGRIHCSLNMNTETGRISSRKPNLMNQPSYDKDVYKIRSAFRASKGNKLIVADYGQLELRILAHMTKCTAMIEAFKLGGDFHSRTAMGMYPQLKEEIQKGELLLEWDKSQGEPPAPLLKEKYSNERKKAKTMNFSIAYGKSAHGFSKDWNCSLDDAKKALEAWFADRKEVKIWQQNTKQIALDKAWSLSLMGRYRHLESNVHSGASLSAQSHAMRASINTPIQGGAADLVIAAMVKVSQDSLLNELGYKLLLQIHDEIILQSHIHLISQEGPEEHAQTALKRVIEIMENPLDEPLLLKMEVDAKIGNNWHECK